MLIIHFVCTVIRMLKVAGDVLNYINLINKLLFKLKGKTGYVQVYDAT